MENKKAFSLIELMVVIVIIGVLAAIAIPSYRQYAVNAKLAEAYQGLDVLTQKELAFYGEYLEFYGNLGHNPGFLDQPMMIENSSNWNPMPIGSQVFFSYASTAGKTDASGTELTGASTVMTDNSFHTIADPGNVVRRSYQNGTRCNTVQPASTYGATLQASYDWTIIAAVADLDNGVDTTCTAILRLIHASPSTDRKPAAQGYIVLNKGE